MKRWSLALTLGVFALLAGTAGPVSAQGFGVYEQGTCAMGRGGAAVAAPCQDGSSVYFNPAGLSFEKKQISLGGALIGPIGEFTNDKTSLTSTLKKAWYPVPNVYASTPLGDRLAAGIGVFAPYGLTSEWPITAEGRFLGYKSVVQAVYVQPTLAWKASDKLSLGLGADITYLNVQLRQRVDLSKQALTGTPYTFANFGVPAGTDFADINLKGNAWSVGAHVGVLIKASEKVTLGARVMTGQKIKVNNGTIETTQINTGLLLPVALGPTLPAGTPIDAMVKSSFAAGGRLSNQSAKTSLPMPLQAVAGLAYQATPSVKLLADYQFVQWSKFDTLVIDGDFLDATIVEAYKNTPRAAGGDRSQSGHEHGGARRDQHPRGRGAGRDGHASPPGGETPGVQRRVGAAVDPAHAPGRGVHLPAAARTRRPVDGGREQRRVQLQGPSLRRRAVVRVLRPHDPESGIHGQAHPGAPGRVLPCGPFCALPGAHP